MRPILRSRVFWLGVLLGVVLAVALIRAGTIHAQSEEGAAVVEAAAGAGDAPGYRGPTAEEVGNAAASAIGGRLEGAVTGGINRWFEGNGNDLLVKVLGSAWSTLVATIIDWGKTLLDPATFTSSVTTDCRNIIFQLPACATVDEGWVRASYTRFAAVGFAALGGGFALSLIAYGAGNLVGHPTAEAKATMMLTAVGAGLIHRGLDIAGWLMGFSNTFAMSFVQSGAALPGYRDVSGVQQSTGDGLGMLGLMGAGAVLIFSRWFTVQYVNILLILLPFAVLFALLPGGKWLTQWWTRALLIGIVVQVPVAIAVGQGVALVARFGAGETSMALVAGIVCLILAVKIPGKLPMLGGGGVGSTFSGAARLAMAGARAAASGPAAPATLAAGAVSASARHAAYAAPLMPAPLRSLPPRPRTSP